MSTIKERIASLSSSEKSILMARLFKSRQITATPDRLELPELRIDFENRNRPFSLTELQQAYWVGRCGAFDVSDVSAHSYWEFENGGIDLQRLEKAWARLIQRHDALRLVFLPDAQQVVLETVPPYPIGVVDLRGESSGALDRLLECIRAEMSHHVLPSDRWPLFQLRCARLPGERIRLFFSFDGLIVDSWSIGILFRELNEIYLAPEKELKPIEPSFRDYVLASVNYRESLPYERAKDYWRQRVADLPAAPELPRCDTGARKTGSRFTRRTGRLDAALWEQFQQRAADAGTTSTGVLMAAYAEVIGLFSKKPRFTLNVPLFNRLPLHPDINQVVGEFASFTLLEIDNSGSESFAIRAKQLQERLWADLNHSAFSGVEVLREMARLRGLSTLSQMPVVFTSLCQDRTPIEEGQTTDYGILGKKVFSINQTPQVWLDNHVSGRNGALICEWDSIDDVFADGCTAAMFEAYCRLLRLLAADATAWKMSPCDMAHTLGAGRVDTAEVAGKLKAPPGTVAQISRIVCAVLELPEVDPGTSLLQLGANSIDFVRISNRLEIELGFRPKMEDLFRLQSVAALATAFDAQSNEGKLSSDHGVTAISERLRSQLASYKVILDPGEREKFKNSRPGVRRHDGAKTSIELIRPKSTDELAALYQRRRSYRRFLLKPISCQNFAGFLSGLYQLQLDGKPKFLYGSPGGLNPTQVYLHVKTGRVEEVPAGTYYYHPEDHRLVILTAGAEIDRGIHLPFINQPIFDEAAFSIFLVADLDAIGPAYGERSLHYVTLEAGIIAHQFEVRGPDFGIGLCQIGAMDFEKIRCRFDLSENHVFVHSLLGGLIAPGLSGAAKESARPGEQVSERCKRLIERIKELSQEEVKMLLNAERSSLGRTGGDGNWAIEGPCDASSECEHANAPSPICQQSNQRYGSDIFFNSCC